MSSEKRKRTRIPFKTCVVIKTGNDQVKLEADTKDISMNGLFVKTDKPLTIGSACEVEIILKAKNSRLSINIEGHIVRKEENGYGIQFFDDMEWWAIFPTFVSYGK